MSPYVLRRVLQLPAVLLVISAIVFSLIHITPGDPVQLMLGDSYTAEDAAKLRRTLGLDRPLVEQYLRWVAEKFVNEPELDRVTRGLLVLASYNAGPTRIAKLRKKAAAMGLDPNRWFGHVEVVVAKEIGRETVQYVSNIYKYYVAYGLVVDRMIARGELEHD